MNKYTKIGIVIADDQEYIPFIKYFSKYNSEEFEVGGFKGVKFDINGTEVYASFSGIGKVNASCCATVLIHLLGCNLILNEGLSGGLQVSIASYIVSERFVEHDFDLSPIGYPLGKKPFEDLYIEADKNLVEIAENLTCAKVVRGTLGTGDGFITDPVQSEMLIKTFDETACDMESAAIASACKRNGIPFIAIRKVSDNANDESGEDYKSMNNKQEADLSVVIEELIMKVNS